MFQDLPENCDFVVIPSRGCTRLIYCADGQPWRGSERARYSEQGVRLSLARFFAAPECGNAAAGGAAEIATRHPPATMHLETHRFVLQYKTRCL